MSCLEDTHLQNAKERIEQYGPGAERLRQIFVRRLESHHAAFYEHGSIADFAGICMAFDHLEHQKWDVRAPCRANLIESILALFAPGAEKLSRG